MHPTAHVCNGEECEYMYLLAAGTVYACVCVCVFMCHGAFCLVVLQGCTGNPPSSAENAIAARDDLNPASGVYAISALGHRDHAAVDIKMTNWANMDPFHTFTIAQAGPTYDQQPAFAWSTTTPDIAQLTHLGMPDLWQMPYVTVSSHM